MGYSKVHCSGFSTSICHYYIYGEGNKAFVRLQEEIHRTTGDYSLFAWDYDSPDFVESIFASSPSQFRKEKGKLAHTKDQSLALASIILPRYGGLLRIQIRLRPKTNLGPKTEHGNFPAYLNCQRDGKWVCLRCTQIVHSAQG